MNGIRAALRAVRVGALLAWTGTLPAIAAETAPSAEAGWAEVTHCARQETERARHDCLDQVLRDAGLLTPEMHRRQQQRAFGLESAAPAPPAVDVPPAKPLAQAVPEAPPDRVEVVLAAVSKSADGKLILTTRDGAVWRQTESQEIYQLPEAGEPLIIRRGALGAYLCTPQSKLSFRCARSR